MSSDSEHEVSESVTEENDSEDEDDISSFTEEEEESSDDISDSSASSSDDERPVLKRRRSNVLNQVKQIGKRRRVDEKVDNTLGAVLEACEAVPVASVEQRSITQTCLILKTPMPDDVFNSLPEGKKVLLMPRGSNACDSIPICIEREGKMLKITNEAGKKAFEGISREKARNSRLLCLISYASDKEKLTTYARKEFPKAWFTRVDAKSLSKFVW